MMWGRYIDRELDLVSYEQTVEMQRTQARRQARLNELLQVDQVGVSATPRRDISPNEVVLEDGTVLKRDRAPQADDPDDPFGLYDKSDPTSRRGFKDPAKVFAERG